MPAGSTTTSSIDRHPVVLMADYRTFTCYRCKKAEHISKDVRSSFKQCSGCRTVRYCSVDCQRADWPTHKFICRSVTSTVSKTKFDQLIEQIGTNAEQVHYLHQLSLNIGPTNVPFIQVTDQQLNDGSLGQLPIRAVTLDYLCSIGSLLSAIDPSYFFRLFVAAEKKGRIVAFATNDLIDKNYSDGDQARQELLLNARPLPEREQQFAEEIITNRAGSIFYVSKHDETLHCINFVTKNE